MKTRKSISKRFKFTKNGKVMRRATGQDHTRAKQTGDKRRKGRKWILVAKTETKQIKRALNS
jgi:large subunit ribosomal protein L35